MFHTWENNLITRICIYMVTKYLRWHFIWQHVSAYTSKFNFCNRSALIKNTLLWFHAWRSDPLDTLKSKKIKGVKRNCILKQNIRNCPAVLQHKLPSHLPNIYKAHQLLFDKSTQVKTVDDIIASCSSCSSIEAHNSFKGATVLIYVMKEKLQTECLL